MDVGFTNLLIIAAIGFAAPLAVGFAPAIRVPFEVVEIVAGIVVGPAVLGWVSVDGQIIVASATIADFATVILLALTADTSTLLQALVRRATPTRT